MAYYLQSTLAKLIEEQVPDTRLKSAVLLDYLSSRGRVMKGEKIDLNWNVITAGSQADVLPITGGAAIGTLPGAETVNTNTGDAAPATLPIGVHKIYHQFNLNTVELVNAKANGVGRLRNIFQENINGGLLAIRRRLNTLLWTGVGDAASAGITGVGPIMNNFIGYAGITPATPVANIYQPWNSIVLTNGLPVAGTGYSALTNRALTRALLYDLTRIQAEEEVYGDALFVRPSMAQTYTSLFDAAATTLSVANTTGGRANTDLGFNTRSYMGMPIIEDPQMPAGQLVAFNTQDVTLYSMDLASEAVGEAGSLGFHANLSSVSSADIGGLIVNIAMLPQNNPGILTIQMFVVAQLRVANRRSLSAILNLS